MHNVNFDAAESGPLSHFKMLPGLPPYNNAYVIVVNDNRMRFILRNTHYCALKLFREIHLNFCQHKSRWYALLWAERTKQLKFNKCCQLLEYGRLRSITGNTIIAMNSLTLLMSYGHKRGQKVKMKLTGYLSSSWERDMDIIWKPWQLLVPQ